MVKRKRIGISLGFNEDTNSGVVNYIFSIVSALKYLEDKYKPKIILLYTANSSIQLIKEINYPYIEYRLNSTFIYPTTFIPRGINYISKKILQKSIIRKKLKLSDIGYVFPYFPFDKNLNSIPNKIQWFVDFNYCYFPHHYADNGEWFKKWHSQATQTLDTIVLSSYESFKDLQKFYPDFKNTIKILRFAASLPSFETIDKDEVLKKFSIKGPYFITPNQFWEHKNHITLLQAFNKVVKKFPEYKLVLTGSIAVTRGKGFIYEILQKYVTDNKLNDSVYFLGAIDRKEQLRLMKQSAAIVQPSLYEGWSTIVEEGKALNKFILLSDIAVNREQINTNCLFFDPLSSFELAEKMIYFIETPPVINKINYKKNLIQFSQDFLKIFDKIQQ